MNVIEMLVESAMVIDKIAIEDLECIDRDRLEISRNLIMVALTRLSREEEIKINE